MKPLTTQTRISNHLHQCSNCTNFRKRVSLASTSLIHCSNFMKPLVNVLKYSSSIGLTYRAKERLIQFVVFEFTCPTSITSNSSNRRIVEEKQALTYSFLACSCHPTAENDGILPLGWANLVVNLLFQTELLLIVSVSIKFPKAIFLAICLIVHEATQAVVYQ